MNFFRKNLTTLILPILFFLLNFLLKILYLDYWDVAGDEPFTIFHAQKSLGAIIEMLKSENNPAFHFFFLHYWIKVFGLSAFSVRFPSLIFSSGISVFLYIIGKKFFNVKTGITAALIFTFSTMHVYFSHEARVYPLFALLTAASLFFYLSCIHSPEEKKNYVFLFFVNLLLIYSHYFGFFIIFIELFSLFFATTYKKIYKNFIFIITGLLLCYIPNIIIFLNRFMVSKEGTWVVPPKLGQAYGFLNLFINNRYNMLVLLIILAASTILLMRKNILTDKIQSLIKNVFLRTILAWFIVPYFLMFILSFKLPMFVDRYILYLTIPYYLFLAILLNSLIDKESYKSFAIALFTVSMVLSLNLKPDNNRRLKEVALKIKELKKNNNALFISPSYADLGFTYYYNRDYFKDYENIISHLNDEKIYPVNTNQQFEKIVTNTNNDILYLQAGNEFVDPDNLILKNLQKRYKYRHEFHIYQIYVINHFYN
jgi:mannosyltransferase